MSTRFHAKLANAPHPAEHLIARGSGTAQMAVCKAAVSAMAARRSNLRHTACAPRVASAPHAASVRQRRRDARGARPQGRPECCGIGSLDALPDCGRRGAQQRG
eukprot:6887113-Prymnesium_polylepis.1